MEEADTGTQPPDRGFSNHPPPSSHGRTTAGPVSVKKVSASPPPIISCPPLYVLGRSASVLPLSNFCVSELLSPSPPRSTASRSAALYSVKRPAARPQRAQARREPSPSPAPRTTWVLLDRCVHRSKRRSGVMAGDPTTSDIAYDCVGRQIRVSLRVADPPLVSRMYLHWTQRPTNLRMSPPYIIAAHRHSILFEVTVPFEDPCWFHNRCSFPIDYFVYSAVSTSTSSSLRSLVRLPPVIDDKKVPHPRDDEDVKPYRRQHQRYMIETDMALFCHNEDGEFTVAHLTCYFGNGVDLCILHHPPAGSSVSPMKWRHKKLQIPPDMRISPGSSWWADTTFPIDGCLCWVDYYHGMLLVDVLLANSDSKSSASDQQQQLLRFIPLPQLALESSRPYTDPFSSDPFRHISVTDEGAGIVKFVCIFTKLAEHTFTIMTWTLDIHTCIWVKDYSIVIRDSEFFSLFDAAQHQSKSKLPKVKPSFPVVSLANPDVVYFLLHDDDVNDTYWTIEINMKEKVMQSIALYVREEEEEGYLPEKRCWIFEGQYFVTSRVPSYLGQDEFESRKISIRMEEEARQRLAMLKEARLAREAKESEGKENKANETAGKQRRANQIDGQVLEVYMAKPLLDKKPDHSQRSGGGPNYPLPQHGGYMGDPYGAYGGGAPPYNQPEDKYPNRGGSKTTSSDAKGGTVGEGSKEKGRKRK